MNINEVQAEILGLILTNPDLLIQAQDQLTLDSFAGDYADVWKAILTVSKSGRPVDILTVHEQLKDKIPLSHLASLTDYGFSPTRLPVMVGFLKENTLKRRVTNILHGAIKDIQQDADIEKRINDLTLSLMKATASPQARDKAGGNDLIALVERHIGRGSQLVGLPTGIPSLDRVTSGLIPSMLWILGGPESSGKSTLAAQVEVKALLDGAGVIHFSTEDATHLVTMRMVASLTGITIMKMLRGNLSPEERMAVDDAMDTLAHARLQVYDSVYGLSHLRIKAKRMAMEQGLDLIVLDYLQNVRGHGTIYERMSEAAIFLQDLPKELDCTVFVLSQLSNEAIRSQDAIAGYKGAGELAAACHVGLKIIPNKEQRDCFTLQIRKNKYGPVGSIEMEFTDEFTRVAETKNIPPFV
ncbi:MAG TPA: hypothetical protein ENN18_01685 [Proteobacteria bacterium]|nr:hypothetical protein [Pseudomonadota bacterium]